MQSYAGIGGVIAAITCIFALVWLLLPLAVLGATLRLVKEAKKAGALLQHIADQQRVVLDQQQCLLNGRSEESAQANGRNGPPP
jgi:hypothetical protein